MRLVFLLCAAFALSVAAGPVEQRTDVQKSMETEEKSDESLSLKTEKFEKEEVEIVPVVQEEGRNSCPSGWAKYGSRCFMFVNREMPWIDGEKYCLRFGANLASIHSLEEYEFIQEVVKGSVVRYPRAWIGGSDAVKDGAWFWSDGSGFDFPNWNPGEPNNSNGNERCLEMNESEYHLWNDLHCEFNLPFVCGRKA